MPCHFFRENDQMRRTSTIVIGGGQAGLAMSACLTDHQIAHVIFERHRVAESWQSGHWDSLRLLTPNWMTRLPGFTYSGPEPDGFMRATDVATLLKTYAGKISAPVLTGTDVISIESADGGYTAHTSAGAWFAPTVVIATGYSDTPHIPAFANCLPGGIRQLHAAQYRSPESVPKGKVMVVGASSSGLQIAYELAAAGRAVTLSVGRHIRMPRRYRGYDVMWWLDRAGILDERVEDVADISRARRQPSLQLSGQPAPQHLNLKVVQRLGVRMAGRLIAVEGSRVRFGADLEMSIAQSEAKLMALLARIDRFAGLGGSGLAGEDILSLNLSGIPEVIDLAAEGYGAVVWATGYRRNYNWLKVPILDSWDEIIHLGGITPAAGLYAMGLNFMRRRKSTFIDGVGPDAEELVHFIAADLGIRNKSLVPISNVLNPKFHAGHHDGLHDAIA
jgi:putative flavoprotein involved in K+ transport